MTVRLVGKSKRKTRAKVRHKGSADQSLVSMLGDGMDNDPLCEVSGWISTGSPYLDWAISGHLEGGGIPIGRLTECYGGTSTGKTLLAMEIAIRAQRAKIDVVYYDTEAAFSVGLFERLGGDAKNVVYRTPDTVEDLFEDLQNILDAREDARRKNPMLVIWDSVAASSSREEMGKRLTESMSPATHARKISQALRKLSRLFPKHKMAFFITNQIRKTISSYGAGYTTFGGMAVGFYSSARIELFVKGKKTIKGKRIVGIDVIAKIKKNKVHIPYMEAKFPIYFNHGIDEGISVMHMAEDMGIASRAGSWRTIKLDGTPIKYQTKTWNKKVWIPHRKAVLRALNKAAARWLEE